MVYPGLSLVSPLSGQQLEGKSRVWVHQEKLGTITRTEPFDTETSDHALLHYATGVWSLPSDWSHRLISLSFSHCRSHTAQQGPLMYMGTLNPKYTFFWCVTEEWCVTCRVIPFLPSRFWTDRNVRVVFQLVSLKQPCCFYWGDPGTKSICMQAGVHLVYTAAFFCPRFDLSWHSCSTQK